MRTTSLSRLAISVVVASASAGAWADTPTQPAPAAAATTHWGAGLLVSGEVSPYRGVGNQWKVWPLLQFENARVRLAGPSLDLKLHDQGALALALRARYADTGYEASDSASLAGMAERKNSIWLGAKVDWRDPAVQLSAEWLADASGHSKGQQLKLVAEHAMQVGVVGVVPRLGMVWQDRKYVDYHFGVSATEALAGRPAYAGKAALSTEVGVRVLHRLAPQQSVFMDLSATALGSSIKDSPLVDRSWVSALRVGYVYSF
jgi:MipA family protein